MTASRRHRLPARLGVGLSIAVTAAVVLLAGCSGSPGVAATVGDTTISQSELLTTTEQIQTVQPSVTTDDVLTVLIIADQALAMADSTGAWKPDVAFNEAMAKIPGLTETTRRVFEASSAMNAMTGEQQSAVIKAVVDSGVEVNPRFGTFDSQRGLVAVSPNWIATSTASPTATTTP